MIYSTKNKEELINVVDVIGDRCYGYNLRTEQFVCLPQQQLTKETIKTVFKAVGIKEFELIGRVAALFVSKSITMQAIADELGISIRSLHRYIKLNEI